MEVTYTWKVMDLICTPTYGDQTNVVRVVRWKADAVGTMPNSTATYTATMTGVKPVLYNNTGTFVDFNQLSEEVVLEWVWEQESLPPPISGNPRPTFGLKERTERILLNRLESQIIVEEVNLGVPWNTN
jgi:hypothetical protein